MAGGRQGRVRQEVFNLSSHDLHKSLGSLFLRTLNGLRSETGFNCAIAVSNTNGGECQEWRSQPDFLPHLNSHGVLLSYHESFDSQQGTVWRETTGLLVRVKQGIPADEPRPTDTCCGHSPRKPVLSPAD